jgi:hypothetical protein
MQLKAMRVYAKKRGWKIAHEVQEIGSGAKTRPKREDLRNAARHREVRPIRLLELKRFNNEPDELMHVVFCDISCNKMSRNTNLQNYCLFSIRMCYFHESARSVFATF